MSQPCLIAPGDKLVVASHNPGKVAEIGELLRPLALTIVSAGELGLGEPEETGETFAANARLKAWAAVEATGLPALADDSGLEVAALDARPGIHSARWAGPARDFALAMRNIEEALQARRALSREARAARFVCALCLAHPDGRSEVFEGVVEGHLVWPPRGNRGFGYDPMFVATGHEATFGEMDPAAKHAISHRAAAFAGLLARLGRSSA